MFNSVKTNSTIYILHKDEKPRIVIGNISGQPVTRNKYQVPGNYNLNHEMVTDINVKSPNQMYNLIGLPANLDLAETIFNGEKLVVSDNKEAMNAHILTLKQESTDVLNSIDYHKNLLSSCDKLLSDLNPEYAEKQAQKQEIDMLKLQMSEMIRKMNQFMDANSGQNNQLSNNKN